ncbi:MAG: hypothetical protein ACM3N5_00100, partial [Candidatus Eiseniibacteriota bacterium]
MTTQPKDPSSSAQATDKRKVETVFAAHSPDFDGLAGAARPHGHAPISRKVVSGSVRFMDVVIALSCGVAAYYFYVVDGSHEGEG